MFKQIDGYVSNKDLDFLKSSDLIIGWNQQADIEFINKDEKFIYLLSRLAYVFEIVDEEFQAHLDYEEFVDILKGLRIKKTLEENNITLPEIAEILAKIDEAKKISILIKEEDEDIIQALMGFSATIGILSSKVGVFFVNTDKNYEFKILED